MSTRTELLTPAEAAVVAGVTLRDVHRVFDEELVPTKLFHLKNGGRWLQADACAYVRFYFHTAKSLTADERSLVIRKLASARSRTWEFRHAFLTVHLHGFYEETQARHACLHRAREMVVEDPDILGGTPVIRGTRIPVHDIAASLSSGKTVADILAAYPSLDAGRIDLAKLYSDANPSRGRPRRPAAELELKLTAERKIARRPRA